MIFKNKKKSKSVKSKIRGDNSHLRLKNISFSYDKAILDKISLSVDKGDILSIVGPSGSGKTTLLKLIAGLERPKNGNIYMNGETISSKNMFVNIENRKIGMVFQQAMLFPHLTIADNVKFGIKKRKFSDERVAEVLDLVELSHMKKRHPHTLSGGEAQRIALARALAPKPEILLLDEPFANIDASLRTALRTDLRKILDKISLTTIFVTHDQEEAFVFGDKICIMNNGQILQFDTPTNIYRQPNSTWIAGFLGQANLITGQAKNKIASTVIGEIPLSKKETGSVKVMIRPENLDLLAYGSWQIQHIEYYGHDTMYTLENELKQSIRVRALQEPTYKIGSKVGIVYTGPPTVVFTKK
tara:strand:- start:325 stop:1395 length:1071 start_codon:yes stop_codon:yes gene_type:complete